MTAPDTTLEELAGELLPGQRLIGLDIGSNTIGVALSDEARSFSNPSHTIKRTKFSPNAEELLEICHQQNVGAFVLGLPLNMNGTEGPRVQSTRAFARNLRGLTDLPIVFWDERLSTAAVTRTLLEADTSRRKRADVVDKLAAAYILQGVLDRLRSIGAGE